MQRFLCSRSTKGFPSLDGRGLRGGCHPHPIPLPSKREREVLRSFTCAWLNLLNTFYKINVFLELFIIGLSD